MRDQEENAISDYERLARQCIKLSSFEMMTCNCFALGAADCAVATTYRLTSMREHGVTKLLQILRQAQLHARLCSLRALALNGEKAESPDSRLKKNT